MSTASATWTVDEMVVQKLPDQDAAGAAAARFCAETVRTRLAEKGSVRVIFATGNSQLAFVRALASYRDVDWARVTVFHLDEYIGLPIDHPAGFRRWITSNVVEPLGIGTVHYLDGNSTDPRAECGRYADLLREHPLDLVCLGIGENGHIAFNEPGVTDFDDPDWVRVVTLDAASRGQQVGEGHFPTIADVPAQALSLTVPAILSASTLQVVAPERRKAKAVGDALAAPVSTDCPATILRTRPGANLFLDADSAALVDHHAHVAGA